MRLTLRRTGKVHKVSDNKARITIGPARPKVYLHVDVEPGTVRIFDYTFDFTFG